MFQCVLKFNIKKNTILYKKMEQNMRRYSMAFIYDYAEFWGEIEGFSDYMISNHKRLYKKSTNKQGLFYNPGLNTNVNKQIELINNTGNKIRKSLIKFIKGTFQIKYNYIYSDEYFIQFQH